MKLRNSAVLLLLPVVALCQNVTVGSGATLNSVAGAVINFGASSHTSPINTNAFASIPGSGQTVGELFFETDYAAQSHCSPIDIWSFNGTSTTWNPLIALGPSGGLACTNSSSGVLIDINTSVVPRLNAANTFTGDVLTRHSGGSGATPTVTVGAAAGSSASVLAVVGNDQNGYLAVRAGGTGTTTGVFFTLHFVSNWSVAPYCQFFPTLGDSATTSPAAALITSTFASSASVGSLQISVSSAPSASGLYSYHYHCGN